LNSITVDAFNVLERLFAGPGQILEFVAGSYPFVFALLAVVILVIFFPQIALVLL
jgi:TRAP-type C4-dicarboxylate transport system permease large subunit